VNQAGQEFFGIVCGNGAHDQEPGGAVRMITPRQGELKDIFRPVNAPSG
jgi:hypothetical protein